MDGMTYEATAVKAPKAKNIKATAKKQAIKNMEQQSLLMLHWVTFKRTVKFIWVNKVPLTVNAFILENGYLLVRHYHLLHTMFK